MSSQTSIIPRSIKGFNTFINKTCPYLVAGTPQNYVRFNWAAANLAAWQAFLTAWTPLFLLYDNRKESYTTAIKNKLLAIITNAVNYDRNNKLIMLIRACVSLNPDDCAVFGLPAKLAVGTSITNSAAIPAGQATPLKAAVLFFRWAKSKHPTLDGPWSVAFTMPVL